MEQEELNIEDYREVNLALSKILYDVFNSGAVDKNHEYYIKNKEMIAEFMRSAKEFFEELNRQYQ